MFCSPMIRSQSFGELVLLNHELQLASQSLPPLRWIRMAEGDCNWVLPFPQVG